MSECCSEAGVSSNGASVDSGPRVTSSSPRNDLGIEDNASLHSLYEKYNIQQKEIERWVLIDYLFIVKYRMTVGL